MKVELDLRDPKDSDFKAIRIYPETNADTGKLQFIADHLKAGKLEVISDWHNWHLLIVLEERDE